MESRRRKWLLALLLVSGALSAFGCRGSAAPSGGRGGSGGSGGDRTMPDGGPVDLATASGGGAGAAAGGFPAGGAGGAMVSSGGAGGAAAGGAGNGARGGTGGQSGTGGGAGSSAGGGVPPATLPADVAAQLDTYNVVWTTPSTTGSAGSMPLGNGDLSANVWVESGGDLVAYLGKSDSWSEATRLLKIGRVRVKLTPNPFVAGAPFTQTLDLRNGELRITAGPPGQTVAVRVWIDANRPVVRFEVTADAAHPVTFEIRNDLWRTAPLVADAATNGGSFRGVMGGPTLPSEAADLVPTRDGALLWYHRNESSLYPAILKAQNLGALAPRYPDPYLNRTFGALLRAGAGVSKVNDTTMRSTAAGTRFVSAVYVHAAQTATAALWENQLTALATTDSVDGMPLEAARAAHRTWWQSFWARSWVFISGDAAATTVTRGYLLHRYLEACNGRGRSPMKFNGGTFTFDYQGQNGDYRKWGPGIWNQNTRHLYWPLLGSGDFDLMKPWFDFYMGILPLQREVTMTLYGHGGAFFPETLNFFGLFLADDWGWSNTGKISNNQFVRYHFQGALEVLAMMLDYYDYTGDQSFVTSTVVPFATEVIRFFDRHWARVGGTIRFFPANAIEEYFDCTNPTDTIAGLRFLIPRLTALPSALLTPALVTEWNGCLAAVPPLPMTVTAAGTVVAPAEIFGVEHNHENPQNYAIFPYKLLGLGRPNLTVAVNTFNGRINKGATCWSQDPIQAPLVGDIASARAYVLANFSSTDAAVRFPAFWAPRNDYMPDLDNGGAGMTGLQNMLLQSVGNQVMILPAWPDTWNVDFKLAAPNQTTVRVRYQNKAVAAMEVTPAARASSIVVGRIPSTPP